VDGRLDGQDGPVLPWTELLLRDGKMRNDLNLRYESRASVVAAFGVVYAAIGAIWLPALLAVAAAGMGVLLVLNRSVYRFFYRKRGLGFACLVVPWHWLFYLYSGAGFALGLLRHWTTGRPRRAAPVSQGGSRLARPLNTRA
jgi:hypothetical protein